ncbi:hypothetical protein [Nocardia miyunensis]|uniref:hypothetical protein n=1 Tax=Nocardia miyunensis TaxID=282684 RepID=UPI00082EFCB9|nr:hypothetical protein [Nocardia miyunensis]
MKRSTHSAAVTALIATAVVVAAGAAHADTTPATTPSQDWLHTELAPGVVFADDVATGIAAVRTPSGTVAVRPNGFDLRDAAGNTVLGTPIDLPATPEATTVEAPPPRTSSDIASRPNTVAAQSAPEDLMSDINQSVAAAAPHMGLAMAVGALGGSVIGIALGCPFGIATGGTLLSLATLGTMTIPAVVATCAVGAVAVGGLGASLGGAAVAIPVGIAAGTQKFDQLQGQQGQSRTPSPTRPSNS